MIRMITVCLFASLFLSCTSSHDTPSPAVDTAPTLTTTAHSIQFQPVDPPISDDAKRVPMASTSVSIDGQDYPIAYETLIRTGKRIGTETFGLLKDIYGEPLTDKAGEPIICRNKSGPDHTTLLQFQQQLFAVSQLECSVGGAYVMKLNQDDNGKLHVTSLKPVDFSGVFGTYVGCAGVPTPWGTHLGSEEYEIPMGLLEREGYDHPKWGKRLQAIALYHRMTPTAAQLHHIGYYQGWIPEIALTDSEGSTHVTKHYAMGRFAHELAYVMPDRRTVYLSDDGTRSSLFMFVADEEDKLGAGVLYAVKWQGEGDSAQLSWISLGHAENGQIEGKLKDMRYNFDSMWLRGEPAADGHCAEGFRAVNSGAEGFMCLKLRQGQALYASRLETRLYAAWLGATTEFNKEEGITYNPDSKQLYVAISRIEKGMEDRTKRGIPNNDYDLHGHNDIRMPYNRCGAVFALELAKGQRDTANQTIASDLVAHSIKPLLRGIPLNNDDAMQSNNHCDSASISMPDNLSYLPGYGMLLIAEDTNENEIDRILAYDVNTKRLTPIFHANYGGEATSPYWYPNIGGHGYITAVAQHPFGEKPALAQPSSASDYESYVGYIGPLPALKSPAPF